MAAVRSRVTHGVDGVDELAGFAELHQALAQVVQGPLHQHLLLLVVIEEVIPEGLLGQGLGVPHNDHPVPVSRGTTAHWGICYEDVEQSSPGSFWELQEEPGAAELLPAAIPDVAQHLEGHCSRQLLQQHRFLLQARSVPHQTPSAGFGAWEQQGRQGHRAGLHLSLWNQRLQKSQMGTKWL